MDLGKSSAKYCFYIHFDDVNERYDNVLFKFLQNLKPELFVDLKAHYTVADIFEPLIGYVLQHKMNLGIHEGPFLKLDERMSSLLKCKFASQEQLFHFISDHVYPLSYEYKHQFTCRDFLSVFASLFPKSAHYHNCKELGKLLNNCIWERYVKVPWEFFELFQSQIFKWKGVLEVREFLNRIELCQSALSESPNSKVTCLEGTFLKDYLGFTACNRGDLPFLVVAVLVRKALENPLEEQREIFLKQHPHCDDDDDDE